MNIAIFGWLAAVSLLELLAVVWWQWRRVNLGKVAEYNFQPEARWQTTIDRRYWQFNSFFKRSGHYLYFYSLVLIRRLIILTRSVLALTEKRFSRLIEAVSGRGVINKRDTASLWLLEVKNHKERLNAKAEDFN